MKKLLSFGVAIVTAGVVSTVAGYYAPSTPSTFAQFVSEASVFDKAPADVEKLPAPPADVEKSEISNSTGSVTSPIKLPPPPKVGSAVAAADVSAGTFGANTGGGNYAFPANLSIAATTGSNAGVIMQDGFRLIHSYGTNNLFVGMNAGNFVTTGIGNTAVGVSAGVYNTSGHGNTMIGHIAGLTNTTGNRNTMVGESAGTTNSTGNNNVMVGGFTGQNNTTGENNTMLGAAAGSSNMTGGQNTMLGYTAGYELTTGSGNVFLGHQAGYNEKGSNKLYISNTFSSSPLIYGDFANGIVGLNANVGAGTMTPQSKLEVAGGYLQASYVSAGVPAVADCTTDAQRGRIVLDSANFRLYVCTGAARGWDYSLLTN
jgi:hypothetical protein